MKKIKEVTVLTEDGDLIEYKTNQGYITETNTYRVEEYWDMESEKYKKREIPVHNVTIQISIP